MEYYEEKITSYLEKLYTKIKTRYLIFKTAYSFLSWDATVEFVKLKTRVWAQRTLETGKLTHPRGRFCELVYHEGINKYVVRFPKTRGPGKVSMVLDEKEEDVTSKVREYMGPCHNFHGIITTPIDLDYKKLTFSLRDGRKLYFEGNDPISIH